MGLTLTELSRATAQHLDGLLSGQVTREAAARWAVEILDEIEWEVPDPILDDALDILAMIDSRHGVTPDDYIFDFSELVEIRAKLSPDFSGGNSG